VTDDNRPPPIDKELVDELVLRAHGDFDYVQRVVGEDPQIVNGARDWGGGDWETALGAASHMGRRDIALFLIEHGARMDIFAAAMLGELDIVLAMLRAHPELADMPGPHGIPLVKHAEVGGEQAREVLALLTHEPAGV
jgi:hypothetical protein